MATGTTATVTPPADQTGPNIKSTDYAAMADYWDMVRTILAGAQAMRDSGEKFLPRFQNEKRALDASGASYDPYEERRKKAPFTNVYEDISLNLASKPFAKEIRMADDTPDLYEKLAEDIDQQGNNLHVFASEVFTYGINYAITWVLVDFSRAIPRSDGMALSVTEEQNQGLRPYWVHIHADRMLAVYSDVIDGIEIITHARIYEPAVRLEGFVERKVERVRVINREPDLWDAAGKAVHYMGATWEVWELVIQENGTGAWSVVDAGTISLGIIPLVKFVTGERLGMSFQYIPPLRTLAYMQVEEYQQESNLKNIIEQTCFPMLVGKGVIRDETQSADIAVGPRVVLYGGVTPDGQAGTWEYLEPTATSVQQVNARLEKTQNDMRDLGMQPLTQSNLTVITTGQVAVKANSRVQKWALLFKDAIEQCWHLTAMWKGDSIEPEVVIHTDFAAIMSDGTQMTTLLAMRAAGDLSHEGIVSSAMRYDYLPSDFDQDKNALEIAKEQANNAAMFAASPIDPRTGKPLNPPKPAGAAPGAVPTGATRPAPVAKPPPRSLQ